MEKRIKKTLLIFFISSFSFLELSFSEENKVRLQSQTITIGIPSICPYACESSDGTWRGYIIDILQEKELSRFYKFRFKDIPNSRLTQSLRSKQIDMAIAPAFIVRYESDIQVSKVALGFSLAGLISSQAHKIVYTDVSDLNGQSVVIADLGNETKRIIDEFESLAPKAKVTTLTGVDLTTRLLKLIDLNRVKYGIADYNLLKYAISANPHGFHVQHTSIAGYSSLNFASLNKKSELQPLENKLELWLIEARKNGNLKKILEKYNLEDWQTFTDRL